MTGAPRRRGYLSGVDDQLHLHNERSLETGQADPHAAPFDRGQPPADGDPPASAHCWPAPWSPPSPIPKAFRSGRDPRGLDRPRAATELQRQQGAARRHRQAGDRYLRQMSSSAPWRSSATPCATARAGRGASPTRPPDGLGDHDQRRTLPGAGCGRRDQARRARCGPQTREGRTGCNATAGRYRKTGKTHLRQGASSACFSSGPVFAEGVMASGHGHRTNRSNSDWPHRTRLSRTSDRPCQRRAVRSWRKADIRALSYDAVSGCRGRVN